MNKPTAHIISAILFLSCLFPGNLYGQKIAVTVNKNRIFIGEQIFLKLSLENSRIGTQWFQFPDTINHLEIIGRSRIDTVTSGSYTNFYQTIRLTSFDSGRWEFPSLAIAGVNQITMPVSIEVLPVDVSKKSDYNEIKDIEEVLINTSPVIVAVLIALTLFSLFMLIVLVNKKKNSVITKLNIRSNETPLQWALGELNKITLPSVGSYAEAKNYYAQLNMISRTFFSLQLQQNTLQQTTDEWMINIQRLHLESDLKISFYQFLRLSDSVRFAKFLPMENSNVIAMDTVKNMLNKAAMLPSHIYSKYQPKQF